MTDVPLEKHLRRKVVGVLNEYDLYYESKPPMGMGGNGLDLTVNLKGAFLAIEIKRSPKYQMTERQAATAARIVQTGGMFMLIRSQSNVDRLREVIRIELGDDAEARAGTRLSLNTQFKLYVLEAFKAQHEQIIAEQKALHEQRYGQVNDALNMRMAQLQQLQQQAAMAPMPQGLYGAGTTRTMQTTISTGTTTTITPSTAGLATFPNLGGSTLQAGQQLVWSTDEAQWKLAK